MTDSTREKAMVHDPMIKDTEEKHEITAAESREGKGWSYRPDVDILEESEVYRIIADVPGAQQDRIDVSFEDGVLSIDAPIDERYSDSPDFAVREFGVGNYFRRFRISDDVDVEKIDAAYDLGVLTVTLPKRVTAQRRRIEIKSA